MNRREFLKAAVVAIAGAFVPSRSAEAKSDERATRRPLTEDEAIAIAERAWMLGLSAETAILAGLMASICDDLEAGIKYLEWKARTKANGLAAFIEGKAHSCAIVPRLNYGHCSPGPEDYPGEIWYTLCDGGHKDWNGGR